MFNFEFFVSFFLNQNLQKKVPDFSSNTFYYSSKSEIENPKFEIKNYSATTVNGTLTLTSLCKFKLAT